MEGHVNRVDVLADEDMLKNQNEKTTELSKQAVPVHSKEGYNSEIVAGSKGIELAQCGQINEKDGCVVTDSNANKCGGLCFYPDFLQSFTNHKVFLIFFCVKNILHSMVFTYLIGIQTSVERQFHFSSWQFGLLPCIGQLGPLLTAVFLGYFLSSSPGDANRPRWMAAGHVTIAIGVCFGLLSYFVSSQPDANIDVDRTHHLCVIGSSVNNSVISPATNTTETGGQCIIDSSSDRKAYIFWVIQYLLISKNIT